MMGDPLAEFVAVLSLEECRHERTATRCDVLLEVGKAFFPRCLVRIPHKAECL